MRDYVNMDGLKSDIREIFADKIAQVEDDPYFVFTAWSDEDVVEEQIEWLADSINKDMCKYIHMSDHRIAGNFNNVKSDYIYHEQRGGHNDFCDMIRRLDDGVDDEQTNADRDWLTAWFWETFGTFGIGYKFATELDEALYCAEQEELATA